MSGNPPTIHRLDWQIAPADLLARWPHDQRLVALISAGDHRARWSIFGIPARTIRIDENADPLAAIDRAVTFPHMGIDTDLPFLGGWIVALSYALGRAIEPAAQHPATDHRRSASTVPLIELHRCDSALIHDASTNQWTAVGFPSPPHRLTHSPSHDFLTTAPDSLTGRDAFIRAVQRCVSLINDGHIFQANLAHHLACDYSGSPRTLMQRLLDSAAPGYAAYIESETHTICSISPELFLDADFNTRRVSTRPIKGTRPARVAADTELERSEKDRAELAMIVDLMRNDLGRVCEYASVKVESPRTIDRIGPTPGVPGATTRPCWSCDPTGALYHASATISGTMRQGVTLADLLRATFPPGSVTGAPKVRAMQIIDELEPHPRGIYCGAIGFISDHAKITLNVAIRTATLHHATNQLTFPVGAGIVADSNPESEWNETMHKAQMFLNSLNSSHSQGEDRPVRSTAQVRAGCTVQSTQ